MKMWKIITSSMIGNSLEWYDFTIYALLAPIISQIFFPSNNDITAMLNSLMIFALGFLVRPLGGIFISNIGDKLGRRVALFISISLMSISTFCIGLLPNYEQIGILSTIMLSFLRILQGISIGGENGGAIVFIGEHSPKKNFNFFMGFTQTSTFLGILLGTIIAFIVNNYFSHVALISFGWRIPFFMGGLLGITGFVIRYYLQEPDDFKEAEKEEKLLKNPFLELVTKYHKELLFSICAMMIMVIQAFTLSIFTQSYLHKILQIELSQALKFNCYSLALAAIICPIAGFIADRTNYIKLLIIFSAIMIIYPFIFFMLLNTNFPHLQFIAQMTLAVITGTYNSIICTLVLSNFPTNVRYSAMSFCLNIASSLFGGTLPMIGFLLMKKFDINFGIKLFASYISCAAIISLYAIVRIKKIKY